MKNTRATTALASAALFISPPACRETSRPDGKPENEKKCSAKNRDYPGLCPRIAPAPSMYTLRRKIPNPYTLMVYVLAIFAPPLGLLFNGQPLAAVLNLALIVPCVLLGLVFHVLWLVPSLHAVISVYMKREQRRHREIVEAIERHGPPPGWGR